MLRKVHVFRRIFTPLAFVALFLFLATPAVFASSYSHRFGLVGPKSRYLALGDSLAFGFQPDLDFNHGYANYFYNNLSGHGVKHVANMGCPGESSSTFINGGCPYPYLRKFPYIGPQLSAAVTRI